MKRKVAVLFFAVVVILMTITAVLADDGELVRRSMSHTAKPSVKGYIDEAEHAFIKMMKFYVPMQGSDGVVGPVEYLRDDESLVEERAYANPLIGVYLYGPVEGVDGVGFVGHGRRDAFGAISLDDGMTWKHTNLSESADESSSDVTRRDIRLFKNTKYKYPGDAVNIFHAVAGKSVLVAWPSRYCAGGQPNYSLDPEEDGSRGQAIAEYMGINLSQPSSDDLYLLDMYGVGGNQGSVDYAEDKFEQNHAVGEVPYSCLWTARGILVQGDDPRTDAGESSYIRWFSAERLTSGVRDVNRIETQCVAGVGCAITWQEDPEGLRPGQGEGPGEGWSGAIANHQTDVWYSYILWDHFNVVQGQDDPNTAIIFTNETADDFAEKPKPFVPFAMPMRMTDNAKCNVENPTAYCWGSADLLPSKDEEDLDPLVYGLKDMCEDTVSIETGPNDDDAEVCVTVDGLPLVGNTAATRPRLRLYGYDSSGVVDGAVNDSAFVVVVAEESKGLGEFGFTDTGSPCDPEEQPDTCIPFDEGKNIWYYSFSMSLTDSLAGDEQDGLLYSLTSHGNILNQPEVNWETGKFYEVRSTEDMWDFGDYNYELYNTEIARRGSLLAQDIKKVHDETSSATGNLLALPAWKQGVMKQGGPADVMVRRILIPNNGDWSLSEDGNPYAYRNMDCGEWTLQDGSNPFYPEGICLAPAINFSATIPDTCTDSVDGGDVACPKVDENGIGDTDPILQGEVQGEGNTTKVLTWHQCPAEFSTVSGETVACEADDYNLDDQSWYNPLDVSKGHRGYLDGDFVMMLYAWSPNWRLNSVGHDRYELYIRRSFDGAQTFTTLPGGFTTWDGAAFSGAGTVTCETFRSTTTGDQDADEPVVCNSYGAGAAEQARNVTQLKSMKFTTLDPRFAPTAGTITADPFETGYAFTDEDTRDPSHYFIVYETGDNTTTAEGEPEPLDLFYTRAVMFGDNYQVWAEEDDLSVCYPSDAHEDDSVHEDVEDSGFCNEFDQFDQGTPGLEASESSLAANPGGEFLYGAWSQVEHETGESDAMARRVWYIDGEIPDDAWDFGGDDDSGGGGGNPGNGGGKGRN